MIWRICQIYKICKSLLHMNPLLRIWTPLVLILPICQICKKICRIWPPPIFAYAKKYQIWKKSRILHFHTWPGRAQAGCEDKKNMTNMRNMQNMQNNNFCERMFLWLFASNSRVLLTAPPLVLCAGLRSSDAVDMFGLLTAYRFVLFSSSSNALHAVPRRASLRLCRSTSGSMCRSTQQWCRGQ